MSFIVQRGKARLEIPGRALEIGTHSGCQLVLDDPLAADLHATLSLGSGGLNVTAGPTTLGTYLDGELVEGSCPVAAGSELVLGASRLRVEAVDTGSAEVSLTLEERSFFHVAKRRGEFHSDTDEWVRSETSFGRIRPLRWLNGGVLLLVVLAGGMFFQDEGELGAWRPKAVSAASFSSVHGISDAHARVFGLDASDAQRQYGPAVAAAAAMGCAACHGEGGGVDYVGAGDQAPGSAGCLACHGEVIEAMGVVKNLGGRHPFDHSDAGRSCSQCHREHRGGEVPQHGFEEGLSCTECHAGEDLGSLNALFESTPKGPPAFVQPTRGFEGFSHDRHKALECTECHAAGEGAAAYTVPKSFSSCLACHAEASDRETPFRVKLTTEAHETHGGETCLRCHEAVLEPALKERLGLPPALASVEVSNHSHEDVIEGKDCRECHLKPISVAMALPQTFDHALHLERSEAVPGAAACLECHIGMNDAGGREAPSTEAQGWSKCLDCHDEAVVPKRGQRSRPQALAEFSHAAHKGTKCAECHVTPRSAEGAWGVERLIDEVSCATCHFDQERREHRDVTGGEECMHCHGGLSEAAQGFVGAPSREGRGDATPRAVAVHREHERVKCEECHLAGDTGELVIPNEASSPICLQCHQRTRFHWRYSTPK